MAQLNPTSNHISFPMFGIGPVATSMSDTRHGGMPKQKRRKKKKSKRTMRNSDSGEEWGIEDGPKFERCVLSLKGSKTFKPRKGQTKKSAAFAVCTARVGRDN